MAVPAAMSEPVRVEALTTVVFESNQTNAASASDREEGWLSRSELSVRRRQLVADGVGLELAGEAGYEHNLRYSDLSNGTLDAVIRGYFKPFVGFSVPRLEVGARGGLRQYRDSDLRDGMAGSLDLTLASRLTERLSVRAGYIYDWRRASSARVFDLDGQSLFAAGIWRPSKRLVLYTRYRFRVGDTVSAATPSASIMRVAKAVAADNAFGPLSLPAAVNQTRQRFAYRIDATRHDASLGLGYVINRQLALDVGGKFRASNGDGGDDYRGFALQAGITYRF
ncbi:MAG: hypothetical protein AAF458_07010 [Pseudomonadota bacterium]